MHSSKPPVVVTPPLFNDAFDDKCAENFPRNRLAFAAGGGLSGLVSELLERFNREREQTRRRAEDYPFVLARQRTAIHARFDRMVDDYLADYEQANSQTQRTK